MGCGCTSSNGDVTEAGKSKGKAEKFYGFDGYGVAEPHRMLLTHSGVPWEDCRIKLEDWPPLKHTKFHGRGLPALETMVTPGEVRD